MKKILMLGVIVSLFAMTTQSYANPPQSGVKKMPSMGPWEIVAFFDGGAFQGCAVAIGGDGGGANQYLRIALSADKKDWNFIVPGPDYEPIPEGTKADVSTDLKKSKGGYYQFTTTINNGAASTPMNREMIWDFFNLGDTGPSEISFNAWINQRQTSMGWTLSYRQGAYVALKSCIDQNVKKQVKKPVTQNPYTMKQKPSVGAWQVGEIYKNGKFEACAAALPGSAGNLIISQNAQEAWRLEFPAVAQLKGHASAQVKERLGNMKENTVSVSIGPDGDGLARDVSHGWVADFFAMAENEDYYRRGIVRDTYQVRLGAGFATTMKWNLTSQEDALMAIEACVKEAKKSKPAARGTPKFQPRAAAQNTNKFGIYTVISINRDIVKDVIVQGKDIYIKIPSGGNITVKKSAKYNGPYSKWYKSGLVKRLGVSNSNRGTNKKDYTYRMSTNAKFIEYYVNGALVLHLVRE